MKIKNEIEHLQKEKQELMKQKTKMDDNTHEILRLKEENEKLKKEIKDVQNRKQEMLKLQKENEKLKNENERLQKEKQVNDNKQEIIMKSKELQILDANFIESLEKVKEIGTGGGGRVYEVLKKETYALKEMNTENLDMKNFKHFINEYEIISILHHPNIIRAFGIFLSNKKIPPSILLEYFPMNLTTAVKNKTFTKEQTVFCIYQIVEGMKYVHFHKIIHRDLKPNNILVASDGTIKICDFGVSKLMTLEEQTMTLGVGTQKFMAPEIINEEENYDEKVDVYSFGVVVFFILSGGQIPKIKVGDILKGKKAEIPSTFTKFSKDMINECWNFKSKDRPSFKIILEKIEKNNYNLLAMTETELKNVKSMIKQHKATIQSYEK